MNRFGFLKRSSGAPVQLTGVFPLLYSRASLPSILSSSTAAGRRTLSIASPVSLAVGTSDLTIPVSSFDLHTATWDSAYTTYADPAVRAGKDVCVYATANGLIFSPNSTAPTGYTTSNSRKIIGFHCLPPYFASATDKTPIYTALPALSASHPFYGFLAGDIMPRSIWDLALRPDCTNWGGKVRLSLVPGMWGCIYKQSGTGLTTQSSWNATATRSRTWGDTYDDFGAVGERMFADAEWQLAMTGCPEGVNVAGSVDPVTTGLFLATNGLPNISNDGLIGGPGEGQEWLDTQAAKSLAVTALSTEPAFTNGTLQGKGSIYTQGADIKLAAGRSWLNAANSGSRGRTANNARGLAYADTGSRGLARTAITGA